ncbi:MAG: hypothetical protein AAF242_02710 [Bacteroidota bacterium]
MTNKDNAIRTLDTFKARSLGSGIRTATLEQVAAQRTTSDIVSQEQLNEWRKQAAEANPGKTNYWIVLAIVFGTVSAAVLLVKYKVIKL